MNNTDNVQLNFASRTNSLLQSKKVISGEISKEPCLDILLTDLEQSSFSLLSPEITSIANSRLLDLPKLQGTIRKHFKPKFRKTKTIQKLRFCNDFCKTSNKNFVKFCVSLAGLESLLRQACLPILQNKFFRFAKRSFAQANGVVRYKNYVLQKLTAPNSDDKAIHLKTNSYLFNVGTLPNKAITKLNPSRANVEVDTFVKVKTVKSSVLRFESSLLQNKILPKLCFAFAWCSQSEQERITNISSVQKIRPILCLVKVGDYVHCGDKIGYSSGTPIIISESGKILKISQTQITIQKMQPVLFYSQAEIHVESNEWVKRGTPILTLAHQTLVTGDIVQGIPRIEQLFEASMSAPAALQDFSEHSENDSQSNIEATKTSFLHYLKSQDTESKAFTKNLLPSSSSFTQIRNKDIFCEGSTNLSKPDTSTENFYVNEDKTLNNTSTAHIATEEKPMLLYKTLQSQVRETFRKKWDQLPLPVAVRQSLEEIQQIIVESIQKVYLSQGVLIADKHIEIIVRQMTSKAQIFDGGSTGLLIDEILSLQQIENANISTPGQKAIYLPVVMGLTRAALSSDSFVSAASFQETTRVLSRDAVAGKTDFLRGLKEKVIIGDLIDAGTGLDAFYIYSLFSKKVFSNKFRKILNRKITHKTLKKLVLTVAK